MRSKLIPPLLGYHVVGGGAAPAGPVTAIYDTFTDTDATLLINHTPDVCPVGAAWAKVNASYNYAIAGNKCYGNAYSANTMHTIESGLSDCTITTQQILYYNGDVEYRIPWVIFRKSGATFWKVGANYNTGKIQLYNPGGTLEAEETWTDKKYTTQFDVVVTLNGTSISAVVDGITISATSATNQAGTEHGLHIYNASSYVDSFKVETL